MGNRMKQLLRSDLREPSLSSYVIPDSRHIAGNSQKYIILVRLSDVCLYSSNFAFLMQDFSKNAYFLSGSMMNFSFIRN